MIGKKNGKKKSNDRKGKPLAPDVTVDGSVLAPGRRFAARAFDYVLYVDLVTWAMALVGMYLGSVSAMLISLILAGMLMFFLEPLMLKLVGTTPGKALLGLYVTNKDGGRLKYMDGISRMDAVMGIGSGWLIPVGSQIRMWKCFRRGQEGKLQPWDKIAPVRQTGKLSRWAVLFCMACIVLSITNTVILEYAELPGNRGELTVEEFSENFARQTRIWNVTFAQELDENGNWQDRKKDAESAEGQRKTEIPFRYTEENGKLTAISLTVTREGAEEPYLKMPTNQILVAVSSYVWAQKEAPFWSEERMALLREVLQYGLEGFELEQAGVAVTGHTELEGFLLEEGKLKPVEGAEKYSATFTFTMELLD